MEERYWQIGELAAACGLTVRALHHFDRIGLLRASARSSSGHRRYTAADVERLYRVLVLRELGMPLRSIAASLDGDGTGDLEAAVREQLAYVERQQAAQQHVRDRLLALLRAFRRADGPSIDQLLETMEAMMQANDFTRDQLAAARQRHEEPGFADRFAGWKRRGAEIVAEVEGHVERGTDPADPAVQALTRQWAGVIEDMSGGDPAMVSVIYRKIDVKGAEAATQGVLTAPAWEYLKRAMAVGFSSQP